jgi:uncharacterized protein YjbI with pentapeptide repeats
VRAKLAGAHLGGADLRGADLSGADWQRAYLQGAWLHGAELPRDLALRASSLGAITTERPAEPVAACEGSKFCRQSQRCVAARRTPTATGAR